MLMRWLKIVRLRLLQVALQDAEDLDNRDAIHRIALLAQEVNQRGEDIGARRLYTVMEKLLEEISFEAPERHGEKVVIDANYVDSRLQHLIQDADLSRYIL